MAKNENTVNRASLLPNTGIDDYYLWIYPDVPERCTTGFVGFVGSNTNPDIKIRIEIDHISTGFRLMKVMSYTMIKSLPLSCINGTMTTSGK